MKNGHHGRLAARHHLAQRLLMATSFSRPIAFERAKEDTVQDVLVHHKADELGMGVLVVEGEGDQKAHPGVGRLAFEVERALDGADAAVGVLEDFFFLSLLATETIVDHALACAGAGGRGSGRRARR